MNSETRRERCITKKDVIISLIGFALVLLLTFPVNYAIVVSTERSFWDEYPTTGGVVFGLYMFIIGTLTAIKASTKNTAERTQRNLARW